MQIFSINQHLEIQKLCPVTYNDEAVLWTISYQGKSKCVKISTIYMF